MVFRRYRLLAILFALGVLASALGLLSMRYSAERRNRAVEIAVDFNEMTQLAGATHKTVTEVLRDMKEAGATTVAVQELTGTDLVASGLATVSEGPGPVTELKGVQDGALVPLSHNVANPIKGDSAYALSLPYGLPSEALDAAKRAGMPVVVRLANYPGVQKSELDRSFSALKRLRIGTVIFAADQVLGFRGEVDDVAAALKANGLYFGSVEFSKQKGDDRMSKKMLPDVIRVHSIPVAEMATLDRPSAVERFTRATKERNIRLCYVRMFDLSDANPLQANADYIREIAGGIRKEGLLIAPSHPFTDPTDRSPKAAKAARAVVGLSVAAGLMLLILSVVILPRKTVNAWMIVFAVVFAGLGANGSPFGLKLVALAASIIFPTLSIMYVASFAAEDRTSTALRSYLWPAVKCFIAAFAISLGGGLMIAGILGKLSFMLHIDQFLGVKLASIAPILILAFAFAAGIGWKADTWEAQKARTEENIRRIASEPVLFWQTALALVLLVMVALLVMRSGNDSGVGVSPLELKFRSILDRILFVRPRTKEIFVGHPALLFGTIAALAGRRSWAAVLLVVGAFGQISLLNTLCHIHTPVALSILRDIIGAVVGLLITYVIFIIGSRLTSSARMRRLKNVRRDVGVEK